MSEQLPTRSAHHVEITFDGTSAFGKLICPDGGCVPGDVCSHCARQFDDTESEGCYDCKGATASACWIKGWFDDLTLDELLHGTVTVEIDAQYDFDHVEARIVRPAVAIDDAMIERAALCMHGLSEAAAPPMSHHPAFDEFAPDWRAEARAVLTAALGPGRPEGTGDKHGD